MPKQSPTVLEFIQNGKTTGTATSVEFEGFSARGDEGNGLRFFKTSAQDTASQTPIQRGDNSFTDVNGYVYKLNNGSVIYFNGANNWFPGLGSEGAGTYTSTPLTWILFSQSVTSEIRKSDTLISFNSGLNIDRGYGSDVTFTRLSNSGNINKSGVLQSLSANQPGITKNGLSCFSSYNAAALYSEDFSNAVWVKDRLSAVDNGDGYFKVEITDGSSFSRLRQLLSVSSGGDFLVLVKEGNVSAASIRIEGGSNMTEEITLNSEAIEFRLNSSSSISNVSLFPHSGGPAGSGNVGDFIYVKFAQCVSIKNAPYIKTDSTVIASSPTVPTAPMNGNMPRSGEEFTILIDSDIPDYSSNGTLLSTSEQNTLTGFVLRKNGTDGLFFISDGTTAINVNIPSLTGKSRVAVVFDKTNIIIYVNGSEKARSTASFVKYDILSNLLIGRRVAGSELNSEVKNIEIFFSALNADEIAAKGGYQ